jgi:triosephosphate isomerase
MGNVKRETFICGNWKLNKTIGEAVELVSAIKEGLRAFDEGDLPRVAVAPVSIALDAVSKIVTDGPVALAAQNGYPEKRGAFTGEVSFDLLADVGCRYAIVGHSERRGLFGETDDMVNKKARAALAAGLLPIICVGESLAQREADETEAVVGRQVEAALAGMEEDALHKIVLAYEPIWAIGTGKTATPEQAQQVHAFIRTVVEKKFGPEIASGLIMQYGGSVKPANAKQLLSCEDVDGALVGGASLKADSFVEIIRAAL